MFLLSSTLLISFAAFSQVRAQFPQCGNDYNCYYQELEKSKEQEKQEEEAEQDSYRSEQLLYQERQLEEVEQQNELMEQQLQEDEAQDRASMDDSSVESFDTPIN